MRHAVELPGRDGKNQGEDNHSPKQACSCWFARHSWLATRGVNLYPPGVFLFAYAVLPFSDVTCVCSSVFFFFCFSLCVLSMNPLPFVQSFFDMHAPRQLHAFSLTTVGNLFCFCFFGDVAFPTNMHHCWFFHLLYGQESTSNVFLPDGVFRPCLWLRAGIVDKGLCENSVNAYQYISVPVHKFKRKIWTTLNPLSIPQSGGKNVKTFTYCMWELRL